MVSIIQKGNCYRYRGLIDNLDTLDKSKITNGSTFYAIDEGKTYMFDGSSKNWCYFKNGLLEEEERLA